jgi:hypothetical protein
MKTSLCLVLMVASLAGLDASAVYMLLTRLNAALVAGLR